MITTGWNGTIRGKPDIGASAERTKRVDERDIELFAQITGDRNPLHFDAEAAGRSMFGGLIVQGGITSGLLNAIVAEDCQISIGAIFGLLLCVFFDLSASYLRFLTEQIFSTRTPTR